MKTIYEYILKSLSGQSGKVSSTRIMSYILMCIVLIFSATFLGIEISSCYLTLSAGTKYVISNEIIIIFGMIFSHILILSGINKSTETKKGDSKNESPSEL